MATKKKAAKPAKKTIAKKPAAKPAAKKAVSKKPAKPAAKKAAKPVAKKAPAKPAPKKAAPAKSATVKPTDKKTQKTVAAKTAINKQSAAPVKKAEPAKPEVKKTEVAQKPAPQPQFPPPPPKKPAAPPKPVKVVIPEIKTKTVRKYEPEFTKSVLDQPENIQTGPTMRYSDAELAEFKDLILKKLDQAKKELTYLQGLITRKDEMGGDENENRYMTMEDGSMASRQINYIDHLEKALMRIENKTYGICRVTGKLIDKARLRAVPHATLSIEAKQMMNK
jgi:RNA polymerase-binding transcription factor DksA